MLSSSVCWPVPESAKSFRYTLARHTLVWIRPECRVSVAAQVADNEMNAQVVAWLAADRPLVVARQPADKDIDCVRKTFGRAPVGAGHARDCLSVRGPLRQAQDRHAPLLQVEPFSTGNGNLDTNSAATIATGLALPPTLGKRRIALNVAAQDIARYSQPLLLADAIAHAPAGWQSALGELDAAASDIGIELRVFGSLAWQALSGIQYLTPRSDIDLLWQPQSNEKLQQGIALLAGWERSSGLRADGEVLFGGDAVSWREWATLKSGGDQRVLVKRISSAELVAADELLELLA
jgi:phosphoribosyl-dephospho-CoA transferase